MIIKNIRVGSDEGGFACGPCGGSDYVEVEGLNEDGSSVFALISVYEGFEKVMIAPVSLFDRVINMMNADAGFDTEWAEIENLAQEEFDYECDNAAEALKGHPYLPLINAARLVMAHYLAGGCDEENETMLMTIIALKRQNTDKLEIPFISTVQCQYNEDEKIEPEE